MDYSKMPLGELRYHVQNGPILLKRKWKTEAEKTRYAHHVKACKKELDKRTSWSR